MPGVACEVKEIFLAYVTPGVPMGSLKKNSANLVQPFGQL